MCKPPALVRQYPQITNFSAQSPSVPTVHLQSRVDEAMEAQTRVANPVNEFCREHGISRGHFYNLLKRGEGPTIMKVGRRTLISAEAATEWRRRMEVLGDAPGRGRRRP